ncbi:MAG TPA: UPF0182 family protein [Vicinamibacterales bacterium]|nr:UPF0182 family protein [Vicinamibacterales bacterium]
MRLRAPIILGLILLVTGIPAIAEFYTDWLWFQEVGYEQVFLRSLTARSLVSLSVAAVAFLLLAGNLIVALKSLRPRPFMVATPQGPQTITVDPRSLRPLVLLGAALLSVLIGLFAGGQWETWLYYRHATPFGRVDPILGRDIGFYVFTLPLLEHLQGLLFFMAFVVLAVSVAAYLLGGEVAFDPVRGFYLSPAAMRHLGIIAAVFLLILAFGAWLQIPQMLITRTSAMTGASYVDVHARMPAQRVLVGAALISAVLALWAAFTSRGIARLAIAVGVYVVVAFGGSAYAAIIQRFVVNPNQQVRETPFIVHNIAATRQAFGLDGVQERGLSGEARLTRADLERNAATIENVPLWNDRPLLDTFGQLQEIRTYYDFISVDNDRYTIDGKYRQIMLSARELNPRSLPSRTWINEHLTFTHGYGLTLGPVNEVTREGLPVLFIRDLPPVSTHDLKVDQPAIYYGELSNDHVFVNTNTEEFDFPRGEANVFTKYQGRGGVQLSSAWRRLLFAIRFRSTDTFFAPNLTRESRVMLYRQIAARLHRIAPFLTYDPDPYLAISNGRLMWMQDVYTTSARYPYSTHASGINVNYIRNAIKTTIDAYDGTTTFHVVDPSDPIAQTIGKVFPGLLQPLDVMPEDLRTRLRYPQQIFSIQAAMFAVFHMTNPAVFYNREDQWEIPMFDVGGQTHSMQPYYTIMKLPGEPGAEYIQMLPYTPAGKDNLAAWMVARSDGANYGKLAVFQFPKQTVIFGPKQIAARISQDQAIAPQITLWNQQGSEVIQGTLLVIPIEESLIYIRPLYLRAQGGQIPELKRVIVAHQNQIVMEETLDAALERIFPGGAPRPLPGQQVEAGPPPPPGTVQPGSSPEGTDVTSLAAQARAHYDRAMQAQREGNWALYGEEIRKLGEVLARMKR